MNTSIQSLKAGSKFTKKIGLVTLSLAIGASAILSSCKKESEDAEPSGLKLQNSKAQALPLSVGDSIRLGGVGNTYGSGWLKKIGSNEYRVQNFFQGSAPAADPSDPHTTNSSYYYSFLNNDAADVDNFDSYDIRFTGTSNGDLSKGPDTKWFKYIVKDYASVVLADTASATTVPANFGNHASYTAGPTIPSPLNIAPGTTAAGWYRYHFYMNFPAGYNIHRPYAIDDLTLLLKTSADKIVKIKMISMYSNATPTVTSNPNLIPATNFPYYWFKFTPLN